MEIQNLTIRQNHESLLQYVLIFNKRKKTVYHLKCGTYIHNGIGHLGKTLTEKGIFYFDMETCLSVCNFVNGFTNTSLFDSLSAIYGDKGEIIT